MVFLRPLGPPTCTLDFTAATAFASVYTYEFPIIAGGTYELTYTINSITGTLRPRLASATGGDLGAGSYYTDRSVPGTWTQSLVAPVNGLSLGFQNRTADFSVHISNVSLFRTA